jgi:hypothetical protein
MADAYRLFVVLDKDYGERLSDLAPRGPVWIVDTPSNREAAQKLWAVDKSRTHLDGVTTFKGGDCSAEDALINDLETIDLHHGFYSANPPYTVLEVIGTVITERLKTELAGFGFNEFQSNADGFRAVRPVPSSAATVGEISPSHQ